MKNSLLLWVYGVVFEVYLDQRLNLLNKLKIVCGHDLIFVQVNWLKIGEGMHHIAKHINFVILQVNVLQVFKDDWPFELQLFDEVSACIKVLIITW